MAVWSKAEFKSTKENVCHEDEDDSSVGMQAWIIVFILGQACSQIKWSLTFRRTPLYFVSFRTFCSPFIGDTISSRTCG